MATWPKCSQGCDSQSGDIPYTMRIVADTLNPMVLIDGFDLQRLSGYEAGGCTDQVL
jgi:hypothetical protein